MVLIHEISLGFLYGHMRFEISHAKLLHGINIRNPEERSLENLVFYHEVLGAFFFSHGRKRSSETMSLARGSVLACRS